MKKLIQRKVTRYDGIIILIIIVFTTFTLLFVQKGEWWNIIQFLGYTLFLMNFFAAEALFYLLKSKKKIFLLIGIGFILLTLPTNIEQVSFAGERHISFNNEELNALTFLKKKPNGVVLTLPVQETSYVSAFSEKQEYIADKNPLNLLGIDYEKRMNEVRDLHNPIFNIDKIKYIYYRKNNGEIESFIAPKEYRQIFENKEIIIFSKK